MSTFLRTYMTAGNVFAASAIKKLVNKKPCTKIIVDAY